MVIQFCPIDIQYETQLNLKFSRNEKKKQRELICNIFYLTYYSKYHFNIYFTLGFQVALVVKNPPANAGDVRETGSTPGSGRCPGGGNGNPLWYLCLENPMDRGAWRAAVHGVAQSQTRLKPCNTCTHKQYRNY